jgi:hypothetical protein
VQAQILASTYASNSTRLQNITNGFGFIGLSLDIIGTSFGVVDAVLLQKSIHRSQSLQDTQYIDSLKATIQTLMRSTDAEVPAARSHIVNLLEKQMAERKAFWSSRHPDVIPFDQSFSQHRAQLIRKVSTDDIIIRLPVVLRRILSTIDTSITFLRQRAIEILQQIAPASSALVLVLSLFGRDSSTALHLEVRLPLGTIPLAVMILGIGCLLVSVICFAVDSQPRTIWTSCVVITSITIFYSSIGAFIMMTLRYDNDNGDLFRRLYTASRQL